MLNLVRENLKKIKKPHPVFRKMKYLLLGFVLGIYSQLIHADLPPAPQNPDFQQGDYMAGIGDFIKSAIKIAVPGILAFVILSYIYVLITSYGHAKETGKWGHFGGSAIIGGVVVMICLVLGNIANSSFTK